MFTNKSFNQSPEKSGGLSRRTFLSGAATAAGVGALGLLGACSPQQTTTSTTSSDAASGSASTAQANGDFGISPSGAQYPWPAEAPEITDADVEEELECDVLVVGLGVSGCAAMRSASEAGAKVIAFEKAEKPVQRSSQYAYINGPHSEAWGYQTWTDEELMNVIETEVKDMSYMVKQDIWVRWARESAAAIEWYCAGVPDFFMPETVADFIPMTMGPAEADSDAAPTVAGGPPSNPDTDYSEDRNAYNVTLFFSDHQAMLDGQVATAEGLGSEARFAHFVEKLIMDGDRCVGLYARNSETGKYVKATAANGVILATGDYGNNQEMIRFFRPDLIENGNISSYVNRDVEGNLCNTGDGYKLGYWAGAQIQNFHAPMTHVMGGVNEAADGGMGVYSNGPVFRINWHGERFMNEEISNVNMEYQVDLQPRRQAINVFDSKYPSYSQFAGGMGAADQEGIDAAVETGIIVFKGETLEELFDNVKGTVGASGFDEESKARALASVERYNELCTLGRDEDFNKSSKYLASIEEGPFYAELVGNAYCLVVLGGLESDSEAHVLNKERSIIPGLYASGNIQGNRFAMKYPFKLGGASHCLAMFYGYIAGQNAAAGV